MIPQYRFFLQAGANDTQHAASPIYGSNLTLNYELQQGQRFFRAKLNGKLTFNRDDYTLIMSAPFGTVFYLYMEKSTDPAGLTFAPYYKSKFVITDCTVNLDDKTVVVQPQTTDQYDEVLAGLENEYNLIQLMPAMNSVSVTKRPLVQVYEAGADIINNYIAGTSWESDVTANDNKNELGHIYWFGLDTMFMRATIESGAYKGEYFGKAVRTGTHTDGGTTYEDYDVNLYNIDGTTEYYIEVNSYVRAGYYEDWWYGQLILWHDVGGNRTEVGYRVLSSETFNSGFYKLGSVSVYFENTFLMARWLTDADSVEGITLYDLPADDIAGENKNYHKVARVFVGCCHLSTNTSVTPTEYGLVYDFREFNVTQAHGFMGADGNSSSWDSENASFLYVNVKPNDVIKLTAPSDSSSYYCWCSDAFFPTGNGQAFSVCSGASRTRVKANVAVTITAPSDAAFIWLANTGQYTFRPAVFKVNDNGIDLLNTTTPQYFPINGDGEYYAPPASLDNEWYRPVAQSNWRNGSSYWFAYHTVFQLLEQVGMSAYTLRNVYPLWSCISVLLSAMGSSVTFAGTSAYSEFLYDATNPLSGTAVKLFVTPKSNILAGDYTVPAQKAMTTLGKFLEMLKNVYQCYWFIDASNRLRIEHISWFKNGGSYSGTPTIGTDLTELLEKRNDTAWAFGVNEYTYEKADMPQRYQFEWMDDERIPFNGEAIEVLSHTVNEGQVESVNVGDFSSDLDYMFLNPSVFSQDGFALLGATGSGNSWSVPFITYTQEGVTITLQNGYLAFVHLQPTYWVYDMPAKSVKINGTAYTLTYIARHKVQKVSVPLGGADPDFLKLIKTDLGNGEIRAVSIPLESRVAQITLNYDTE